MRISWNGPNYIVFTVDQIPLKLRGCLSQQKLLVARFSDSIILFTEFALKVSALIRSKNNHLFYFLFIITIIPFLPTDILCGHHGDHCDSRGLSSGRGQRGRFPRCDVWLAGQCDPVVVRPQATTGAGAETDTRGGRFYRVQGRVARGRNFGHLSGTGRLPPEGG